MNFDWEGVFVGGAGGFSCCWFGAKFGNYLGPIWESLSQQLTQHPLVCDWLLLVTLLALVSLRCGQWGGTRPHGGTEQGPSFPEVA